MASALKKTQDLVFFASKRQSYVNYLDSLLINPSLIEEKRCFKYFLLKKKYWIPSDTKKGGWKAIADSTVKSYKVGDSATTITNQNTSFITNDISRDSKSWRWISRRNIEI
jgi:hypothetical protein